MITIEVTIEVSARCSAHITRLRDRVRRNHHEHLSTVPIGADLVAPLACDAADDNDGDQTSSGGDEQAVLDVIADYRANFVLINAAPFLSAHGINVNVWVDSEHADQFKFINPANPVPLELPEGTIVIKEHLDAQQEITGGTVMVKGPPGTDPSNGDWWYAKGDLLKGSLEVSGPGLASCLGCHSEVSKTDFLHGVAPANQT